MKKTTAKNAFHSVDECLAAQPPPVQPIPARVLSIIRQALIGRIAKFRAREVAG